MRLRCNICQCNLFCRLYHLLQSIPYFHCYQPYIYPGYQLQDFHQTVISFATLSKYITQININLARIVTFQSVSTLPSLEILPLRNIVIFQSTYVRLWQPVCADYTNSAGTPTICLISRCTASQAYTLSFAVMIRVEGRQYWHHSSLRVPATSHINDLFVSCINAGFYNFSGSSDRCHTIQCSSLYHQQSH